MYIPTKDNLHNCIWFILKNIHSKHICTSYYTHAYYKNISITHWHALHTNSHYTQLILHIHITLILYRIMPHTNRKLSYCSCIPIWHGHSYYHIKIYVFILQKHHSYISFLWDLYWFCLSDSWFYVPVNNYGSCWDGLLTLLRCPGQAS